MGRIVSSSRIIGHIANDMYLTPVKVETDRLLTFTNEDEVILEIMPNGSVKIFGEGCEEQAAKMFYESLQIEGMTLYARIEMLENIIRKNTGWDI